MIWQYFPEYELVCPCGQCDGGEMKPSFMARLTELRKHLDFAFPISSAFRCKQHNADVGGVKLSYHTQGRAVDIALTHAQAHKVVKFADDFGFRGIGVHQKGNRRFIHLDNRTQDDVTLFSY